MSKPPRITSPRYIGYALVHLRTGVWKDVGIDGDNLWHNDGNPLPFPTHAEAIADARRYIESKSK